MANFKSRDEDTSTSIKRNLRVPKEIDSWVHMMFMIGHTKSYSQAFLEAIRFYKIYLTEKWNAEFGGPPWEFIDVNDPSKGRRDPNWVSQNKRHKEIEEMALRELSKESDGE